MKGRLIDLSLGMNKLQRVTIEVTGDFREEYDRLKDGAVNVEIKRFRKMRSKDANAFCWSLCQQIGDAISPPVTKEEVYRTAIKQVGVYEPLPIKNEAVEEFSRRWRSKGTGWFIDVIDDSKIEGYKLVFAYYGTSTYDTKEMSILIDYLTDEARQMDIQILSQREIELMKEEWRYIK